MPIDIGFKHKGLFADYIMYRNIENHSIAIIEDTYIIRFDKTNRKGIKINYEFQIPRHSLAGINIRRT